MTAFKGRTVLVTGPTTGIGRDLAELFAAEGADLVLASRNVALLDRTAEDLKRRHGVQARAFPHDLARPGASEALVRDVERAGLGVDVLVNNAGYGVYGPFYEADLAAQMGMIELHVAALTYLTHRFLKPMLERRRGGVLNVASTGAFQPVPVENVYCATKAYVLHFTEALAEELRGTGVTATCLCPGPTQTPFFDTPLMKSNMPPKLTRMDSMAVARMGLEGFRRGEPLVVTGLRNKVMAFGVRLAPRRMVARVAKLVVTKKARGKKGN